MDKKEMIKNLIVLMDILNDCFVWDAEHGDEFNQELTVIKEKIDIIESRLKYE